MAISIAVDGKKVPVETVVFSDGGVNLKILADPGAVVNSFITITLEPSSNCSSALFEILLARDAVLRTYENIQELNLDLRYLPHARADRVFECGNGNPLKTFADCLINYFNTIFLTDPHSDAFLHAMPAQNFVVTAQDSCFLSATSSAVSGDIIVSPDKGAAAKCKKLQDRLASRKQFLKLVCAHKARDLTTGKITGTYLPDDADVHGKRCIIVDDICDGGGTFIPLANLLRKQGAAKIDLYVTHGIFSKGVDLFNGVINTIYCYQLVGNHVTANQLFTFNHGE